jgi:CelD/BcsL family acetyltransferase involved in cellulose biosynthesis
VLREIPEDAELCSQWDALVNRVDQPQVFFTYEWAVAVQRAYREKLHPLVILAYDDAGPLAGVAALATESNEQRASFLCATTGDYCDFLSETENKAAFVGASLEELSRRGVRSLTLTNLPADSSTVSALRQCAPGKSFHCFARTAYVCAQVSLDKVERKKDGTPYAPGLKRLRRFEKAMAGTAPVRTEHRRSWETVEPLLPEFATAHVARFLEVGRISNLADPLRRTFLEELGKLLCDRQWFVFSRMLTGDRPVAWHYGFVFGGSWFWYQPTFDSVVDKHWPGFCLLSQVIQDAIETPGMNMLDLGLGSEIYKVKFANSTRETLHITLSHSLIAHLYTIGRYRLAESVKKSPRTERVLSAVRDIARKVRGRIRDRGVPRTLWDALNRARRLIWRRDEVMFFEAADHHRKVASELEPAGTDDVKLRPLTLGDLALAVGEYRNDEATCAYLTRAASRLRTPEYSGYVLVDAGGRPVHFAWAAPFSGFFCSELETTLEAAPDLALLFDCWTPTAFRGRGYYAQAISLLASAVQRDGKRPWIFSAGSNAASIEGIKRAGFHPRHSVSRWRFLMWRHTSRQAFSSGKVTSSAVSAGA